MLSVDGRAVSEIRRFRAGATAVRLRLARGIPGSTPADPRGRPFEGADKIWRSAARRLVSTI
jgi:hypothetical protein